jgi:hypothetical protein
MKNKTRKRPLGFERLEVKATPSTLLLALAPLDETFHVAVEQTRDLAGSAEPQWLEVDTSANWRIHFSTHELLHFVDQNTIRRGRDTCAVDAPTAEQCQQVDEMMKLGDHDTRALVISDSLTLAEN